MTRQFNTDMERDINRIAIATEKILKLLKERDMAEKLMCCAPEELNGFTPEELI